MKEEQRTKDLAGVQIYPLSKMDNPPKTKVVKVDGRPWQGWQPRGFAYFETLADILLQRAGSRARLLLYGHAQATGHREGKAVQTR